MIMTMSMHALAALASTRNHTAVAAHLAESKFFAASHAPRARLLDPQGLIHGPADLLCHKDAGNNLDKKKLSLT